MKHLMKGVVLLSVCAALLSACEDNSTMGDAYISFAMSSAYNHYEMQRLDAYFKASGTDFNIPDTNDFILSVMDASENYVYYGRYGDKPDPMSVSPGTYNVAVYSHEFDYPAFSSPQLGDSRIITINAGESIGVSFGCTQQNSGMRIIFEKSFRDRFFSGKVSIKNKGVTFDYPYNETRIAYFLPGVVDVVYTEDETETLLVTRELAPADIYTLKLAATAEDLGGFSIQIDTTRNWINEDFTVGSGNSGSSVEGAIQVSELEKHLEEKEVWVVGYIVGGDVSASKVVFEAPFSKASNIAIADTPYASTREECAAVELPSSSDVREALNLVDHPDMLGRRVYILGTVTTYYGHPGIKSVKEFRLE